MREYIACSFCGKTITGKVYHLYNGEACHECYKAEMEEVDSSGFGHDGSTAESFE